MARKRSAKATVLIPVKLPIVKIGRRLDEILLRALREMNLTLATGHVLAVASKVVSTAEGCFSDLGAVEVTTEAEDIARKWHVNSRLSALVLEEADAIAGGVDGFLLTVKNGILTANAGVDLKNTPTGTTMRWPRDPDGTAASIRKALEREFQARLGVIIVDSRVTPLRLGTVGLAIGSSGIEPVHDYRGIRDLYGRKVTVTQAAVLDDLACCAHLLMGESSERIGAVVMTGAPVVLNRNRTSRSARLDLDRCLIASNLKEVKRRRSVHRKVVSREDRQE